MDPLTHALSGALLARATMPAKPQWGDVPLRMRMLAGFAAALFPDLDIALRLIDTITYLNLHQGITHSILMLPLWAALLALVFAAITGWRYSPSQFFPPVFLGLAIHISVDLLTSYGLMVFAPFSDRRFSLPVVFVFDPWFSLIVVVGLIASAWRPHQRHIPAIALAALGAYAGFAGILRHEALDVAKNHMRAYAIEDAEVYALPQPLSPFNWKLLVRDAEGYHVALVNLRRTGKTERPAPRNIVAGISHAYRPLTEARWRYLRRFGGPFNDTPLAEDAWLQPAFTGFREFAAFPVLYDVTHEDEKLCMWFVDLRFALPELPPSFRYGACRNSEELDWYMVRARGLFWLD